MKLSEDLTAIFADADEGVTIRSFLEKMDHRSFGFLLVVLPLPTALPFTPPGFTIPFGLLLMVLGGQMVVGRHSPWMPGWVLDRKLAAGRSKKMFSALPKFLAKFEKLVKPRFPGLNSDLVHRLGGLFIVLAALAMMVPFPVTNSICAIAIFLVGLGSLEDDGLACLAGYVLCVLSALVVGFLVAAPFVFGRQLLRMEW
jgi:hypothetical protein